MALCLQTPCFSGFQRKRIARDAQFTGDSPTPTRYATRSQGTSASVKGVLSRTRKRYAKGVPMADDPHFEQHISKTMAETKRSLQALIEEEQAAEEKKRQAVPPRRAGSAWSVAERLTRRFGLGSDPERRQRFYRKLEELVADHGDPVMTIISDCVASAEKARSKQRYFCKAVTLRLRENGFGLQETDHNW